MKKVMCCMVAGALFSAGGVFANDNPDAARPAVKPEATAAKTKDAAAAKTAPSKKQTSCPAQKCGRKVEGKFFCDSNGKRVYFCSSTCCDKTKKEITAAIAKLEAEGIVLEPAEKKVDKRKKKNGR